MGIEALPDPITMKVKRCCIIFISFICKQICRQSVMLFAVLGCTSDEHETLSPRKDQLTVTAHQQVPKQKYSQQSKVLLSYILQLHKQKWTLWSCNLWLMICNHLVLLPTQHLLASLPVLKLVTEIMFLVSQLDLWWTWNVDCFDFMFRINVHFKRQRHHE